MARGTPFSFDGFIGGLNTVDSPYTLQATETRDCLNVIATTRGAIRKRTGSTLFTASPPTVELNSAFAATISGTKWLIVAGGGKIYKVSTAGAVTEIGKGFSGARYTMVQAPTGTGVGGLGPVYMSNGVDAPQEWTGTGEVKPWSGKNDTEHYGTSPFVPNGAYMVFVGNRVWMTGISTDPSAVWFSDIVSIGAGGGQGDPTSWPKTNVVRFDSSDGYPITGIGTIGPYILVFKEHKTWVIHDINTGANRNLASNIGCVANRSITETPEGTFFLTADQGVYLTDGTHIREMSYNVRPTILGINQAQRANAAGAYYNNHFYLSFASDASATNSRTLDYDMQLKSWWLHDLTANQWAQYEPSEIGLYSVRPGTSKGVIQAFVPNVFADVGEPYAGAHSLTAYWFGSWIPFYIFIHRHAVSAQFVKKRVRAIHFDGSGIINPIVFKDFHQSAVQLPAVVGSSPQYEPALPVNFAAGETTFGNTDTGQVFGGTEYKGFEMIFGGAAVTQEARLYSLGTAKVWSVGFGNTNSEPFEVDSFTLFAQFRKS